MVPAKDPPKVKLENFHKSRVLELGELCVPWFVRVLGFLQQNGVDIRFLTSYPVHIFQSSCLGVCCPQGAAVNFEVEPSTLSYCCQILNMQVKLTTSLRPSLWPNMDDLIKSTKLSQGRFGLQPCFFRPCFQMWPKPRDYRLKGVYGCTFQTQPKTRTYGRV